MDILKCSRDSQNNSGLECSVLLQLDPKLPIDRREFPQGCKQLAIARALFPRHSGVGIEAVTGLAMVILERPVQSKALCG